MRILLPTHLFPEKPTEPCAIALDPVFFTGPDGTFKIHKGKLAYTIASCEEYAALHGIEVMYPDEVVYAKGDVCYEPMDRAVEKKLRKAGVEIAGYPGFVLDPKAYEGPLKLVSVYKEFRRVTGLLEGVPSMDAENRRPPDEELDKAVPPKKTVTPAMKKAIAYVEKNYPDHYGDATACGFYPSTRRAALKRLRAYANNGIRLMKYQDAIVPGKSFLGHSVLSAAINIGLIGPLEVAKAIARSDGSISDREGFVRQIAWRELMAIVSTRHPGPAKFGVPKRAWYDASTGLDPLDDCIQKAMSTGYLHHIERLMVVLNAMTLVGLREGAIYRWFMEVVAMDAYDWIMAANIAVFAGFFPGVSRKPYISSSKYVKKMSNWGAGEWEEKWDALFYSAIPRFSFFRHVMSGKKYKERNWFEIAKDVKRELL